MKILCIDTATPDCAVGIIENGRVLSASVVRGTQSHSVILLPEIKKNMENAGLKVAGLDAVAVSNGPGSYTGLRIGVATAKAIAYAANIPLVGAPTLDYMAECALSFTGAENGDFYICPAIDARNTQVFYSLYDVNDGKISKITDYSADASHNLCDYIIKNTENNKKIIFCGNGAESNAGIFGDFLKERFVFSDCMGKSDCIKSMYSVAERILAQGKKDGETFDAARLTVNYVRTPKLVVPAGKVKDSLKLE